MINFAALFSQVLLSTRKMAKLAESCKVTRLTIMDKPIFKKINTPEEAAALFERWIHQREEWEAQIRQREIELGIYDEAICG